MAGKDLVHRARQERATTPLEAHLVGQDGMHLAVAAPVLDENQEGVLGVVHVALPMALLPFLQDGGPKWGQLQFQQQVEIEVATLDAKAQAPMPDATPSFWVNVPGTSLRVAAWMTPESLLAPQPLLIALGSYLLVMGLIAFVLRLMLNRLEQALAADFAGLRAMIEDAVNTWPIRKLQCRLAETQSLMEAIRPLLISLAAIRRRNAQSSRRPEALPPLMPARPPGTRGGRRSPWDRSARLTVRRGPATPCWWETSRWPSLPTGVAIQCLSQRNQCRSQNPCRSQRKRDDHRPRTCP
jgi:hypothetical protein